MMRSTKGFTMIEMLISLAFLSFILIFSVTVIVQVMRTYNKGLSMKEIQQTSRSLLEEVSRSVRLEKVSGSESGFNVSKDDSNGRLCLGGYSYIWNKPGDPSWGAAPATANLYTNGNPVSVVKIEDSSGRFCENATKKIPPDEAVKLVTDRIRIPQFSADLSTDGRLLNLRLVMSTNEPDAPSAPDGGNPYWNCDVGNFFGIFCAVSDFQTTVYLRNGGS